MITTIRRLDPLVVVAALTTVAGAVLRFDLTGSPLWLDEAQTVAIIESPDLVEALRGDGHPPLYYWLLNGWMSVVGDGDAAARSLSLVLGLAALPVAFIIGSQLADTDAHQRRRVAWASMAVAACLPFMIRYSTEARMYSLLAVLAGCWWLAGRMVLAGPPPRFATAGLAATTAAMVLTHYWSFFLIGTGVACALWQWRRGRIARRSIVTAAVALAVGLLTFIPWLPHFVQQLTHTGTPWAVNRNPVASLIAGLTDFTGGREAGHALALFGLSVLLVAAGLFATDDTPRDDRIEIACTPVSQVAALATIAFGTATLGALTVAALGSAFAPRYFAVIVLFITAIAGRGVAVLPGRRASVGLALFAVLGMLGGFDAVGEARSQGAAVAAAVEPGREGALVVACPDQVGPATARYLPEGATIVGYPLLGDGSIVDWTDYEARNSSADPAAIATDIVELAADRSVWLVWRQGYLTYGDQCERLVDELTRLVGPSTTAITADPSIFEPMNLTRFDRR